MPQPTKPKNNSKQPIYNTSIFQNQHRPGDWRLASICRSLAKGNPSTSSNNGIKKRR